MAIEVTKERAEEIIAKARHKDITNSLRNLAEIVKQNNNGEIVEAINKQLLAIEKLVISISELPNPNVVVEVNQDKVVLSIIQVGLDILKGLTELKQDVEILNKPKEWIFTVKRDNYNGYIESVKATMNYTKPKYQA